VLRVEGGAARASLHHKTKLRRVEQNAGAAGIDGMSTKELRPWLKEHWPTVRS
jgi:hypothetical protein